jgi:ATP-dependent Lon protease
MSRDLRSGVKRYKPEPRHYSDSESSETESQEEDEDYFAPEPEPLAAYLTARLLKTFTNLSKRELRKTLIDALKHAKSEIVDEYCKVIPKDTSWKLEVETQEAKKLAPVLKELRQNMQDNVPTMSKILKSNLPKLEKQRAVQLFDVFKNTEPYTLDYVNLGSQIADMLATATDLKPETDTKLVALQSQMKRTIPTAEKIISAFLTESEKIRALQLYEVWQTSNRNTSDWFRLQTQINDIVSSQLKSAQEVLEIESEESQFHTPADRLPLKRQILRLNCDTNTKSKLYEMYSQMIGLASDDSRYAELKQKISLALELPYRKIVEIQTKSPEQYCAQVYSLLCSDVFGMKIAKEKVIQCVNDRIYNPNARTMLALKGKPGVGKTKLAKTIAKAAGLPFEKISLGGVIDSTILKGSDPVWKNAGPSRILQILSRVKYSNAVILLDEIDKLSESAKGLETQFALLHILDPSCNKAFQDAYLNEFDHDISNIWFIPAMNDDTKLDPALRDRLNIVEIPSYTKEELVQIIQLHTLPEMVADKGLEPKSVTITPEACRALLNRIESEVNQTGVRPVEKAVSDIVSKLSLVQSLQKTDAVPLSFTLPGFSGFPYVITEDTIDRLVSYPSQPPNFMYN